MAARYSFAPTHLHCLLLQHSCNQWEQRRVSWSEKSEDVLALSSQLEKTEH